MNTHLKNHIENLGFTNLDAFVSWQLTQYLLHKIARMEAQARVFRQKYGMDYASFEKRMEEHEKEVFEEWDDSIEWEGLEVSLNHAQKMLTEMEAEGQAVYNEEDITKKTEIQAGIITTTAHRLKRLQSEKSRKKLLVALYKNQKISLGKAAELAGIHQIQFQHWIAEYNIPIHYDTDALDEDLNTLNDVRI